MNITEWLDAAQARADAASEGPWVSRRHGDHQYVSAGSTLVAEVGSLLGDGGDGEVLADAVHIAHARTDLPRALAALRAVLDRHEPYTLILGDREGHPICSGCGLPAPCPDVETITAALAGEA